MECRPRRSADARSGARSAPAAAGTPPRIHRRCAARCRRRCHSSPRRATPRLASARPRNSSGRRRPAVPRAARAGRAARRPRRRDNSAFPARWAAGWWRAGNSRDETGLGDRGVDGFRGVIRAEVPVGEARALRRQMRERRHDDGRIRAADAIRHGHQVSSPTSLRIRGLVIDSSSYKRVPVRRIGDALEQVNGRQAARDDAMARREPHRPRGVMKWPPSVVSSASAGSSALGVEILRAPRTGRRPGRTTCVPAPSGRRTAARRWACAPIRPRPAGPAAGSAATCRCRAGRTAVRACRAAAAANVRAAI